MSVFLPQNPGIDGINELTNAEEAFLTSLTGLSYVQGDILYYDGTNLKNLGIGTSGQVLKTNAGGTAPEWGTDTQGIWVENGSNIYYNTGNVGIGTTAPGAKLDISGTGNIVKITNSDDNDALMYLGETSDNSFFKMYTNGGANKTIELLASGVSYFNGGNVGIGTTEPEYKLNIVDDTGSNTTILSLFADRNSVGSELGIDFRDRNVDAGGQLAGRINTIRDGADASFGMAFHTASLSSDAVERMRIDSSGNVGIGMTSPDTKLDVNGAITARELSSDPSDPDEGSHVIWQSDGTGTGDDGDIMMKITAGGVTKIVTLVDFSTL